MNKKSGEIVTGLLVGLAVGLSMLWVMAHNDAVERSNATGEAAQQFDFVRDNPTKSAVVVAVPTLAGGGIGMLVENLKGGNSKSERTEINITQTTGRDGTIIIGEGNNVSFPSENNVQGE